MGSGEVQPWNYPAEPSEEEAITWGPNNGMKNIYGLSLDPNSMCFNYPYCYRKFEAGQPKSC